MSWPNHFPTSGDPLRNRVAIDSQAFAQMSKAFVISACGTVDDRMIDMLQAGPEAERFLRDPNCCGGTLIVDPLARIIAGPMGPEEGILYADCNLDLAIQMKLRHDFAGHYNRPDIFQMHINRAAPQLTACTTIRRRSRRPRPANSPPRRRGSSHPSTNEFHSRKSNPHGRL
jgi:aliphatic nitrilase